MQPTATPKRVRIITERRQELFYDEDDSMPVMLSGSYVGQEQKEHRLSRIVITYTNTVAQGKPVGAGDSAKVYVRPVSKDGTVGVTERSVTSDKWDDALWAEVTNRTEEHR